MSNRNNLDVKTISARYGIFGDMRLASTWYKTMPVVLTSASTETANYEIWLASTGLLSSAVGMKAWSFDATKSELLSFYCKLPNDYKEGTPISPCIDILTTTSTGTSHAVRMLMSYMWTNEASAFASTATEEIITISTTDMTALNMKTTNFTAISTTSLNIGSVFQGVIARQSTGSTDTFPSDIWLNGMYIRYQTDGMGSTYAYTEK